MQGAGLLTSQEMGDEQIKNNKRENNNAQVEALDRFIMLCSKARIPVLLFTLRVEETCTCINLPLAS